MSSSLRKRGTLWLKLHQSTMTAALFIGTTGFLIALLNTAMAYQNLGRVKQNLPHGPLGVTIFILVWLQYLLGYFRPHATAPNQPKSRQRWMFEKVHPFIGYSLVVIVSVQFYYGYHSLLLYASPSQASSIETWAYFQAIATPIFWFCGFLIFKWNRIMAVAEVLPGGKKKTNGNSLNKNADSGPTVYKDSAAAMAASTGNPVTS